MKYCPICTTEYADDVQQCPTHLTVLAPLDEWAPGTIVKGTFRVLGKIGRGGMGLVYRAEHTNLQEPRALKVMRTDLASDPQFTQRFLQEAKTAMKLMHQNSVRIYDLGQADDGKLFMAMEYVEGVSVRELLGRNYRFPPARAAEIVRQVADVLAAAHALGIVHRDLKPDNIMLARGPQGQEIVKVMDFGIAAVRESGAAISRLTQMGTMVGTGTYASPEQISGKRVDGRSDLYSLGITFYEMLSGRVPFEADDVNELARMVHGEALPPLPAHLGIPREVEDLLRHLTAKKPEQRPANALELIREIHLLQPALAAAPRRESVSTMVIPTPTSAAAAEYPSAAGRVATSQRALRRVSSHAAAAQPDPFDETAAGPSRAPVAILAGLLLLALCGAGYFAWAQHQTQQQAAGWQGQLTLLQNRPLCISNGLDSSFRIVHLAVTWKAGERSQWQTYDSDFKGGKTWNLQPGDHVDLADPGAGWDGSAVFYAANILVPGQTDSILISGPAPQGCQKIQ